MEKKDEEFWAVRKTEGLTGEMPLVKKATPGYFEEKKNFPN